MTRKHWIRSAVLLPALALLATPATAQAADKGRHLVARYDCIRMSQPLRTPVEGYLARDAADRKRGLFHVDVDILTAGRLVGMGGTWTLIYQCRR